MCNVYGMAQPGDPANFDEGRSWSDGKWGGYNGQGNCGGANATSWEAANSRHGCALKTEFASDPENLGAKKRLLIFLCFHV